MPKTDRSSPSFARKFIYGFLVASLASLLIMLPFAPRPPKAFVAGATLSCEQSGVSGKLDSDAIAIGAVWRQVVTPKMLVRVANETRLFGDGVDPARLNAYLKSNFILKTKLGPSPANSLALVSFQHPEEEAAIAFLEELSQQAVGAVELLVRPQSLVGAARHADDGDFATIAVVNRGVVSVDGAGRARADRDLEFESRQLVQRASLELFAPLQDQTVGDSSLREGEVLSVDAVALAEARKELKIARNRLRALTDLAGSESSLAQNMAFEVSRLENLIRDLEFAATPLAEARSEAAFEDVASSGPAYRSAVRDESGGQRASVRFVAGAVSSGSPETGELKASVLESPRILRMVSPAVSQGVFLALLALAFVVGVVVGLAVSTRKSSQVVVSQSDVVAAIDSPVVGSVFPSRRKPERRSSGGSGLLGAALVRLSELTLFGFVGFVGFCAVTDGQFAGYFVSDPLGAYASSVERHFFGASGDDDGLVDGALDGDGHEAVTPSAGDSRST